LRQGQSERCHVDGSSEEGREALASLNDAKFGSLLYRIDGVAASIAWTAVGNRPDRSACQRFVQARLGSFKSQYLSSVSTLRDRSSGPY
jgi:hypothetical protein